MRRASVHALFAGIAIACAALAGYDAVRLAQARRINEQVATLSANSAASALSPASNDPRVSTAESGKSAAPVAADPVARPTPEPDAPRAVRLAHAVALSAAQRYAAAGQGFEALIDSGPLDATGQAALFDLANMYLREGAGESADAVRSLPMIEQAKARYRALLRVAPDDWDARYNLERALRLAPETQAGEDASRSTTKHDVKLRGAQSEDLP